MELLMAQITWCVLENEKNYLLHSFKFLCASAKTVKGKYCHSLILPFRLSHAFFFLEFKGILIL